MQAMSLKTGGIGNAAGIPIGPQPPVAAGGQSIGGMGISQIMPYLMQLFGGGGQGQQQGSDLMQMNKMPNMMQPIPQVSNPDYGEMIKNILMQNRNI